MSAQPYPLPPLRDMAKRNRDLFMAEVRGATTLCLQPEQHGPWQTVIRDENGERIACSVCERATVERCTCTDPAIGDDNGTHCARCDRPIGPER
jgi:hypothetical protein